MSRIVSSQRNERVYRREKDKNQGLIVCIHCVKNLVS